jgi:arsenate reductase-like glutaredoxin family protein
MIQVYLSKHNFDAQKVQRFLKERGIAFQVMDLKKHRLGERELDLFARSAGNIKNLIDRTDKRVMEHPAAHFSTESLIREALLEHPGLLVSPITRNGSRILIGYDKNALDQMIAASR